MKLKELTSYLSNLYPIDLKASYDNVGLMVGSYEKDVKKVLLALDLTREVMDEAILENVDLIITHHPLLFHPLSNLNLDEGLGSIIKDLIKYDIANYSLHTNFDSVKMNDYLGDLIGLKNKEILSMEDNIGVYGNIDKSSLEDFVKNIKRVLNIESCDYYGISNLVVEKVGIIGGSGSQYFSSAKEKELDLFITGDMTYSKGIEAKRLGLNVLDVGHHIEIRFADCIAEDLKNLDDKLNVITSKTNVIPYRRM